MWCVVCGGVAVRGNWGVEGGWMRGGGGRQRVPSLTRRQPKNDNRHPTSPPGRVKIACFTTLYLVMFVLLEVWKVYGFDPAAVAYAYESPPGVVMLLLKVCKMVNSQVF